LVSLSFSALPGAERSYAARYPYTAEVRDGGMRTATQVRTIKDPATRYKAANSEAKAHRAEATALHEVKCRTVVELRESGLRWREVADKIGTNPGAAVNLANTVRGSKSGKQAPKRSRAKKESLIEEE
jgi:hypothetical protein